MAGALVGRRTAGMLLVAAFPVFLAGALMFVSREGVDRGLTYLSWERSFIVLAVGLSAAGLLLTQRVLARAGEPVLARAGAGLYLVAAVIVVAAEVLRLRRPEEFYPLIVAYVLLALIAHALIGAAIVRSLPIDGWIGWATIGWSLFWLVVLPAASPGDVYFPVLHHVMPLLIGGALLARG